MSFRKALAAGLMLMTTSGAYAGIEAEDKTISIFGAFTATDNTDQLTVSAAAGYFMTDTLEIQGTLLLSSTITDGGPFSADTESTVTGYGANANLYFPGPNTDFVPYVGAGATIVTVFIESGGFSEDETEFGFNAQAGIKQFLNEAVSVNYQAQLVSAGDYDATQLSIGLSVFFD